MINVNFYAYENYVTEKIYQWDIDRVLEITGLNLATVPEVHFANANTERAIVGQAEMENHVIRVKIPNSILQDPLKFNAYVGVYEDTTFKVLEKITVPVVPRKRPADYQITDADEEVYSFKRLENKINNINDEWINATAEMITERVETWLDDHPDATTTVQDGAITETKFADDLKLLAIKDYVTPEMFGAKGDGVTDDTESLQIAINHNLPVLMRKSAVYGVTSSLNVASNKTILGNGATLVALSSYNSFENGLIKIADSEHIVITDLNVNGDNFLDIGFNISYSNNIKIEGCNLYDLYNSDHRTVGIFVNWSKYCVIDRVKIQNVTYAGNYEQSSRCVQFSACSDCTLSNSVLRGAVAPKTGKIGDGDGDGDGVHFLFNVTDEIENYGNMLLYNTEISGCTKRCVKIQQYGVTVEKCKFPYVADDDDLYSSIIAIYDDYATIKNCYFDSKTQLYVDIGGATSTDETELSHIVIENNIFNMRGGSYQGAITCSENERDIDDLRIVNNTFNALSNTEYGILINRNVRNIQILNNHGNNLSQFAFFRMLDGFSTVENVMIANNVSDVVTHGVQFTNVSDFGQIFIVDNVFNVKSPVNYANNTVRVVNDNDLDLARKMFAKLIIENNRSSGHDGIAKIGYTNHRPNVGTGSGFANYTVTPPNGFCFYDISLHKPIWFYDGVWYDATGVTV